MRKAVPPVLTVLVLLCCIHTTCFGQDDHKVRLALSASGSIKYPFLCNGSRNYHLFGDAGFGVAAKVHGSTAQSLSFLPKLSLLRENIGYHQTSQVKYYIESINVSFNPEILFPTRREQWQIAAGIGIDWVTESDVAAYQNNSYYVSGNLTAAYDTVNAARRPLIPFISAGLLYRVKGGLHLQLSLRQDLRDAFPDNTVVTFISSSDALTVNLSHKPTRLGLTVLYFF